jgi:para-aminobenzoate synthetase component 1
MPLVEELTPVPGPEKVFARLAGRPHCLFLDSAMQDPVLGRYSFLAADPFDYFEFSNNGTDPLMHLAQRLAQFPADTLSGLPPFQGGAAGLLSYDLGRHLENLPRPAYDEFQAPVLAIGLYDVVIAWDHVDGRAWIISQGLPEVEPAAKRRRASQRLDEIRSWITGAVPTIRRLPRARLHDATRSTPTNSPHNSRSGRQAG